jgi:O-antigen/teichoic acid export membrane protein
MRLEGERTRIRRVLRQRAFAVGFLVAGLLVFTWPFVRAPRLDLVPAYAHLAVAWVLVVIGLAAMARALARGERATGRAEDEHRG